MAHFPSQMPSAVILDMDGTTVRHLSPHLINVMEWLDTQAFRISSAWHWVIKRGARPDDMPDWDAYDQRKKPRRLVHRTMHKLRRKKVDQIVEPSPHIYEMLDFLTTHNIPIGLASNGLGAGYGHEILETFKLEHYFKATVFCEEIHKSKPDPESLLLTLRKMNLTPAPSDIIWYIGDRRKDMKAALKAQKALGCTVVPIAYTLDAGVQILKEHLPPDHIIMSYDAMLNRLQDYHNTSANTAAEKCLN